VTRVGGATGRALYIGLLRHGRTLRLHGAAIWTQLGAPPNVDVLVNGQKQRLPRATLTRTFHL
jgi:hypothetical protein